jgi:phosphatidylserine/phosphatidylglycerophosphate/cardiolipin synthase-like enzyme
MFLIPSNILKISLNKNCIKLHRWIFLSLVFFIIPQQLFSQTGSSKSSGIIRVYFTNTVDNTVSTFADGIYDPHMEDTIVAYINKAQATLDMCIYDNRSDAIISAVNQAYSRGVTVRFISETTSLNYSLSNLNSSIPLIKRDDGSNVMHNKFVIIDRDSENNSWLISGSANHTPDNLTVDPNNVVFIQDKTLALAYTTEFEEMWGSSGATPNLSNSKFGAAKADNTPHSFTVGGKTIELYFSPSDGTSAHIVSAINSAQTDFCFAMFTFIHNDIGDAVIGVHNAGAVVKGIIENISYFGSEYASLVSAGIPVLSHESIPNSFHHKYGVADATNQSSDPLVITGSHNWTNSAEDDNDENTLIIHDGQIAAMYYEEFMTRYNEMVAGVEATDRLSFGLFYDPLQNRIVINNPKGTMINSMELFDLKGSLVFQKDILSEEKIIQIKLSAFKPSVYLAKINTPGSYSTIKFVVSQ